MEKLNKDTRNDTDFISSEDQVTEDQQVSEDQIATLSNVLHTLSISERPKVKSVSKKDGKYILKKSSLTTILQKPVSKSKALRKDVWGCPMSAPEFSN